MPSGLRTTKNTRKKLSKTVNQHKASPDQKSKVENKMINFPHFSVFLSTAGTMNPHKMYKRIGRATNTDKSRDVLR